MTAELVKLEIDQADVAKRLDLLAKRLAEKKQRLKATEEGQDIQVEQDVLRGSYEQLLALREDLRRQRALAGKVTVIVVGAGGEK